MNYSAIARNKPTTTKWLTTRASTSKADRIIAGYLLVVLIVVVRQTNAASFAKDELCTVDGLHKLVELNDDPTGEDIRLAYGRCRDEFLEKNQLSRVVKTTVDEWIGTDLSKAETNQIFLAYELALVGPRPETLPDQFEADCNRMADLFEKFRRFIEPLTSRIDINMNSLLAVGNEEIDEEERDLFNFVQYSQFCRSLLIVNQFERDNKL
jgi:hypothetical protein